VNHQRGARSLHNPPELARLVVSCLPGRS
jgi:hypothetical protein